MKTSKLCLKLVKEIRALVDQYPIDSHYFIARILRARGLTTVTGKEWSAHNLRLFMTRQGIPHKNNDFCIENIIAENRPESMRLIG